MALEVFAEAAAAAEPGQGTLDDPAFGKNYEAVQLVAFDDFDGPCAGFCDDGSHGLPLIASVSEDALDEGKQTARAMIENPADAVAILHVGGMNDDVHQQPERVDENVPFAALDLLARIVALRVERGPPFCAPLALCASMMATVGLASRPAFSRVAT